MSNSFSAWQSENSAPAQEVSIMFNLVNLTQNQIYLRAMLTRMRNLLIRSLEKVLLFLFHLVFRSHPSLVPVRTRMISPIGISIGNIKLVQDDSDKFLFFFRHPSDSF